MSKKQILLVAATLVGNFLFSQQDSIKRKELQEVTVIATRNEKKILDVGKSVTVLTSKDFQNLPYQNVADLLSRTEGIFITGTFQTPGSLQAIFVRGADSKQTLVMVDGVKLSDGSSSDNALDLSELSLANIERIEILRGSQGTLYGSSAIGATINIITKKNAQKGLHGQAGVTAGNYGKKTFTLNTNAAASYTHTSGFYGRAEIFNSINNGLSATYSNGTINTFGYKEVERDHFNKTDVAAKLGYNKNGLDVYAGYRKVKQKNDIDDGAYMEDENSTVRFDRNLYTYGAQKNINNKVSVKFFGGYTNLSRKHYDDSSITSRNPLTYDASILEATYTAKNFANELQLNLSHKNLVTVAGIGALNDKMNARSSFYSRTFNFTSKTDYDTLQMKANQYFAFARGDWKINLNSSMLFNLGAGLRFTNHNRFGNFVSYEINPSIKVNDNTLVYATFAKGFNAPSLYQLFAPEKNFTSGITRGSANLEAEKSTTYEAGIKSNIENAVTLTLSIYKNVVENYIDYVYLWNKSKSIDALTFSDYRGDTYLNIGKQTNEGFEINMLIALSPKFDVNINGSINNGKLNFNKSFVDTLKTQGHHIQLYGNGEFLSQAVETKQLVRRPSSMGNFNVTYKPNAALKFLLDVRSISDRQDVFYNSRLGPFGALGRANVRSFVLFNVSAFWALNNQWKANIQFHNIFNKKYQEINGYNTRGRGIWAGLNFSF